MANDGCLALDNPESCGVHQACTGAANAASCTCNTHPAECTGAGTFCTAAPINGRVTCAVDADQCIYETTRDFCAGTQTCGGAVGQAACGCAPAPTCTGVGIQCDSDGQIVECANDARGCVYEASRSACGDHQTCGGGIGAATCSCDAAPTQCNGLTGSNCTGSGDVVNCARDADQCLFLVSQSDCGDHQTCAGADGNKACSCNPAPGCAAAGTVCDGNGGTLTCARDAQQCLYETGRSACGTHQACSTVDGASACRCNNSPGCSAVGIACDGTSAVVNCTRDSQGCFFGISRNECTSPEQCVLTGGSPSAQCTCPAVVTPAVEGGGCPFEGQSTCNGADVLVCRPVQGCMVWQLDNSCAGGLVCGTRTGAAACECPANTGNTLLVHPDQGSETSSPISPTGIDTPSRCQFKKFTQALGRASQGQTVRVVGGARIFTTAEEQMPFSIPAGVALETTDSPTYLGNYVLRVQGVLNDTTPFITLGNGSRISGFGIDILSSAPLYGDVLSCSAGQVRAEGLRINGPTNGTAGFKGTGTCGVTGSNVEFLNFSGTPYRLSGTGTSDLSFKATQPGDGNSLLTMSAGTVTATIEGTGYYYGNGVRVTGGSLTLRGATQLNTVDVACSGGSLDIQSGARITNGPYSFPLVQLNGPCRATLTGVELNTARYTGIRIADPGADMTLTNVTINSTGQADGHGGVQFSQGRLTVTGGNYLFNTGAGIEQSASAGLLTVSGANFDSNSGAGIQVRGPATVSSSTFGSNGRGLDISTSSAVSEETTFSSLTITGSLNEGILVRRAAFSGGPALSFTDVTSNENTGAGLNLSGSDGTVDVKVTRGTFNANGGSGVVLNRGNLRMSGSTARSNGSVASPKAGLELTGGVLVSGEFTNNRFSSNTGGQVEASAGPTGGGSWNLGAASCATANVIACYANGKVGVAAGTSISIQAQHSAWANAAPVSGTDFSGTVDATNACPAFAGSCN